MIHQLIGKGHQCPHARAPGLQLRGITRSGRTDAYWHFDYCVRIGDIDHANVRIGKPIHARGLTAGHAERQCVIVCRVRMRVRHPHPVDKANVLLTIRRYECQRVVAIVQLRPLKREARRVIAHRAKVDRPQIGAVQLHLHGVIELSRALQGNLELRLTAGLVKALDGDRLRNRISHDQSAENVFRLAIEQTREVDQLVLALRGVGKVPRHILVPQIRCLQLRALIADSHTRRGAVDQIVNVRVGGRRIERDAIELDGVARAQMRAVAA